MKAKTLIFVALLAFAAGGTCPSAVDNDGTVGIWVNGWTLIHPHYLCRLRLR